MLLMPYHPLCTEFEAQLMRSSISQSDFARRFGLTFQAVNNWCRGRRRVPVWAWALARALEHEPPGERFENAPAGGFWCEEILGCWSQDDRAVKKARDWLAKKYHPDKEGGSVEHMQRINEAYDVLVKG